MKQKITSLAGVMVVAACVIIAAAATGQASEVDHGRPVSAPTPHATVVFGCWLSYSGLAAPLSELAADRRTPRALALCVQRRCAACGPHGRARSRERRTCLRTEINHCAVAAWQPMSTIKVEAPHTVSNPAASRQQAQ
ncbi:hypothetical protein [Streptomyces sp. NPDC096339]|uniref:hypothetical protein n=1 Tax=Streptomyces sp. NPDC096339 TaxID=3366086 RepID=UPI0038250640